MEKLCGKSQKNSIEAEKADEEKKTDEGTDLEGLIGESEQKLEELGFTYMTAMWMALSTIQVNGRMVITHINLIYI